MHTFPDNLPKIGQTVHFSFMDGMKTVTMEAWVKARAHYVGTGGQDWVLFALSTATEHILFLDNNSANSPWQLRQPIQWWRLRKRYRFIKIEELELIPVN